MAATPEHAARVLGLSITATLKQVKQARRSAAFRYHPDRHPNREEATRHMARINAAVDTLTTYIEAGRRRAKATGSTNPRTSRTEQNAQAAPKAERTAEAAPKAKPQPEATANPQRRTQQAKHASLEETLAQYASRCYARVLDQIGGADHPRAVDQRVLRFQ